MKTHTCARGADTHTHTHTRVHLITNMCPPGTQTRVQLERTCVHARTHNVCREHTYKKVHAEQTHTHVFI